MGFLHNAWQRKGEEGEATTFLHEAEKERGKRERKKEEERSIHRCGGMGGFLPPNEIYEVTERGKKTRQWRETMIVLIDFASACGVPGLVWYGMVWSDLVGSGRNRIRTRWA